MFGLWAHRRDVSCFVLVIIFYTPIRIYAINMLIFKINYNDTNTYIRYIDCLHV